MTIAGYPINMLLDSQLRREHTRLEQEEGDGAGQTQTSGPCRRCDRKGCASCERPQGHDAEIAPQR
jgi:hypothetical protein